MTFFFCQITYFHQLGVYIIFLYINQLQYLIRRRIIYMIIHTTKFKTHIISLRFKEPIKKAHLGYRALLPQLMASQSPLYNSRTKLSEALEDLYGATLTSSTNRQGLMSVVYFNIHFISPKFSNEPLLDKVLTLLHDVVYGHKDLPKAEFETEKRIAIEHIMAQKNNKTNYAVSRLFEIMFENDDYALKVQGDIEDIKQVSYQRLNTYYKKEFLNNSLDIVLSGEFSEADKQLINHYFKQQKGDVIMIDYNDKQHAYQEVIETDDIAQAKLNIGYLLPIRFKDDQFYEASIFNIIFGAGVHSRLFLNVREKHSLCYYIRSQYDPFKGFIFVYSGVDKQRVDLALKVIDEQVKDLQENLITDDELLFSKQSYINAIKENEDSQVRQMDSFYQQTLLDLDPIDVMIEKINAVTKEQVRNVAKQLKKDTLYILAPEV